MVSHNELSLALHTELRKLCAFKFWVVGKADWMRSKAGEPVCLFVCLFVCCCFFKQNRHSFFLAGGGGGGLGGGE